MERTKRGEGEGKTIARSITPTVNLVGSEVHQGGIANPVKPIGRASFDRIEGVGRAWPPPKRNSGARPVQGKIEGDAKRGAVKRVTHGRNIDRAIILE